MATTAKHALRYPVDADTVDIPRDMQNLATDLDGLISVYTEGAIGSRPAAGKSGRWFREEGGNGRLYIDDGETWEDVLIHGDSRIVHGTDARLVPVGALMDYAAAAAPTGWLLCDGTEKAVATYPALDALLGTTYGARTNGSGGAGSTHFRLPDLRSRVAVGAGTGPGLSARALAAVGGSEPSNHPAHAHTVNDPTHSHSSSLGAPLIGDSGVGTGYALATSGSRQVGGAGLVGSATGISLNNTGGGFDNMPPFIVVTKIIKT
jgi:microcystin-dependent protein